MNHKRFLAFNYFPNGLLDTSGSMSGAPIRQLNEGLKAFEEELKADSLAAKRVEVAIVTGRTSRAVELRAENLGIPHLFQGVGDKLIVFEQLLKQLTLPSEAAGAMGDDLPDLPVLRRCGLAACVPEAPALVRSHSHYISERPGGAGAVRELCELVMAAQGTLEAGMQEYLK